MRRIGAAVIADISGSTSFYEREGAQRAFDTIKGRIDRLQRLTEEAGGEFVNAKGDDILAFFTDAGTAVRTAQAMVANRSGDLLAVHAGVAWGEMLREPDGLYGDPVNTAARLASLAKPLEVLVSEQCFAMLEAEERNSLRRMESLLLEGKAENQVVLSYVADDPREKTELFVTATRTRLSLAHVTIDHGGFVRRLGDGQEMSVGRAPRCDLVVTAPWVSRRHATVSVANSIVRFTDHSTGGSYVTFGDGPETALRRASITLTGSGEIALGAPRRQGPSATLSFTVTPGTARAPREHQWRRPS